MAPFPFSELTNEIVDLTMDTSAAMRESGDTWTMLLGVVVTLLPKIMPKMLPAMMGEPELKERFGEEDFNNKIEDMFRTKIIENLNMIEGFIRAWKEDEDIASLLDNFGLEKLGLNSNMIKERTSDLIHGDPANFQDELLEGIDFIQERIARSGSADDHIAKISQRIWDTAQGITLLIGQYLY